MTRALRTAGVLCLALAAGAGAWLLQDDEHGEREARDPVAPPAVAEPLRAAELSAPADLASEPTAERTAIAPQAGAAGAEVLIQNARGATLSGVAWALFRGEEVLASGTTAADGVARFARGDGAAELATQLRNRPLEVFPVDRALERQVVTLAEGAVVEGVVLLDGFAPSEPFELTLQLNEQSAAQDALPRPVWGALGVLPGQALSAATVPGGAFRFEGLVGGSEGWLSWSGPWFEVDPQRGDDSMPVPCEPVDGGGLPVEAPRRDLVLALAPAHALVGRVVTQAGEPVPVASVHASWSTEHIIVTVLRDADSDGEFQVWLREAFPPRVELKVAREDGSGRRMHTLELPQERRDFDAGALAISSTRAMAFRVRDTGDRPIAGAAAVALPLLDGLADRAVTDALGMGEIQVTEDARTLRVSALGFAAEEVALPEGAGPLEITLASGTMLEVRVSDGALLTLRLSGSTPPFDKLGQPSWEPEEGDDFWVDRHSIYEERSIVDLGAENGVYVLGDVRPGVGFDLAVLDVLGSVLLEQAVAPLLEGERRLLELSVAAPSGVLAGRLVSLEGLDLGQGYVMVAPVGSARLVGTPIEDQGRFRIEGLPGTAVRVVAAAEGHAPLIIDAQPLTRPTDPPLELVLDSGRPLRVRVRGPEGAPVPSSRAWMALGDPPFTDALPRTEPGVHANEHAARQALSLTVEVGGQRFERSVRPGASAIEVDIDVPAWQSCTVSVSGPVDPQLEDRYFVKLVPAAGSADAPLVHRLGEGALETRFDVVFAGRYEVFAGAWIGDLEVELSERIPLEVTAGEPAHATLELRRP